MEFAPKRQIKESSDGRKLIVSSEPFYEERLTEI